MRAQISVVFLVFSWSFVSAAVDANEEKKAKAFLQIYNSQEPKESYKSSQASWEWSTNITNATNDAKVAASLAYSEFDKEARANASKFDVSKLEPDTARQIKMIKASGSLSDSAKYKTYKEILNKMGNFYSTGKWKDKALDPDLVDILANNRNYNELKDAWLGWRDATGPKIRPEYVKFVELANEGAREHDWKDNGEWWRSWYEVDDLQSMVESYWNEFKPLYEELHAYVRHKLRDKYGKDKIPADGYIPAHLLGNMWAQSWTNIYSLVEPYKGKTDLDVTSVMKKKNYNATYMFEIAQEFFTSLGLKELPASFWTKSMLVKPPDRDVVCHASAWDFGINKDVRVKQCTDVTQAQLVTAHHELGHIQYYLQYWNQPAVYRTGANPGFHEAVGDLMALSVNTPKHLKEIGLLEKLQTDKESDVNVMMKVALGKIAFLPFGYLMDQWRWRVFSGEIPPTLYNAWWWYLRRKYQGIDTPVCRTEEDFDPGAKYHIPGNTPYIRYFMSYVLQFQFHDAACKAAGHTGDLHTCDIYKSTGAGDKIGKMLELGKSKPWPKALKELTGSEEVDPKALLRYFKPLIEWLRKQRESEGYPIGWYKPIKPKEAGEICFTESDPNDDDSGATFVGPAMLSTLLSVFLSIKMLF